MNQNKITNLAFPTQSSDATTKEYVDKTVAQSGLISILSAATSLYVVAYMKENAECFYAVDEGQTAGGRGTRELDMTSGRRVKRLFDKTLSRLDAVQTINGKRPLLSTELNAKRFFLQFDGVDDQLITSIDLNPAQGEKDIVNIFILFRLASFNGPHSIYCNGLFGHDNQGWDKFVAFTKTKHLMIAGVEGKDFEEVSNFQPKANPSELNKWCSLSMHWVVTNSSQPKSSCWCNGQKIHEFTASTSPGSPTMVFGDIDPTTVLPLHGDVQMFALYKGAEMSENVIKAHHKMICERFGIEHDEISFGV